MSVPDNVLRASFYDLVFLSLKWEREIMSHRRKIFIHLTLVVFFEIFMVSLKSYFVLFGEDKAKLALTVLIIKQDSQ